MWSSAARVPVGIQPTGRAAGRRPRDPPGLWRGASEPPSPIRELGAYEAPPSPNGRNARELPSEKFKRETNRVPKSAPVESPVDKSPAISPVKMSAKAKKDHAALDFKLDTRSAKVPLPRLCKGCWRMGLTTLSRALVFRLMCVCTFLPPQPSLLLSRTAWRPRVSSRTGRRCCLTRSIHCCSALFALLLPHKKRCRLRLPQTLLH